MAWGTEELIPERVHGTHASRGGAPDALLRIHSGCIDCNKTYQMIRIILDRPRETKSRLCLPVIRDLPARRVAQ